jgi:hypothetical protein
VQAMKTIELDLEKDYKLDGLSTLIRNKKIRFGEEEFQLKIHSHYDIAQILYASFLLLLVKYFIEERNKIVHKNKPDIAFYDQLGKTYYEGYLKTYDVGKLETKIEKDFKIDIELEKKNPLDEVFGIWRTENITIDKIRQKAWQRTK